MAERPSGGGERRDRALSDAESTALGNAPAAKPKPLPEAKPMSFSEATEKILGAFGVKHNVNGKEVK